jgi:hypothetical protein
MTASDGVHGRRIGMARCFGAGDVFRYGICSSVVLSVFVDEDIRRPVDM